jgi:hypothetical protein
VKAKGGALIRLLDEPIMPDKQDGEKSPGALPSSGNRFKRFFVALAYQRWFFSSGYINAASL